VKGLLERTFAGTVPGLYLQSPASLVARSFESLQNLEPIDTALEWKEMFIPYPMVIMQMCGNNPRTSIANLAPYDVIEVELEYLQIVGYDGLYSLRLPMTITPRYDPPSAKLAWERTLALFNRTLR